MLGNAQRLRFAWGLALVGLWLAAPMSVRAEAGPADHRDRKLRVGADEDYPPYEFVDEAGRATGFDVELFRAVAQTMELDYELVTGPWSDIRRRLETGELDMVVGMHHSEEREALVDFSMPYALVHYAIFVRKGTGADILAIEDLSGRAIIVQTGAIVHDMALAAQWTDHLITVDTPGEALRLLASGEHDCALLFKFQGQYMANRLGLHNLTTVGPELRPHDYCFAVREGATDLLARLNEGLSVVKATGRYEALYEEWFGLVEPAGVPLSVVMRWALWFLVPLVLALALWALWTRSLRRQVGQRTNELQSELNIRRLAEEALAGEREQLAVTLRSIGDGVITTDTGGRIQLLNPVAEALTGWGQEEAQGRSLNRVLHILDEKTREPRTGAIRRVVEHGTPPLAGRAELLIDRDGNERVIAASMATIQDHSGGIRGVVIVLRDITDLRKMEAELLRSEKLESLGVLAGGIAHDFNNILATLTGHLSLALSTSGPCEEQREYLEQAQRAARRARGLTQQLLTFARGGAPVKTMASLAEVIRDSAVFARSGSSVRCQVDVEDALWPAEVDLGQISQVMGNLILNAVQAMPEGGTVQIAAHNETLDEPHPAGLPKGDYVRVSVRDEGGGIPDADLPRIFEPFYTTKVDGTGLGLATAYSIITRHGGWLGVDSVAGVGTTFEIYLPARPSGTVQAAPADAPAPPTEGRVLVMDDDEEIRAVAEAMLRHLGFEVSTACDGQEALALYTASLRDGQPFDVVIMDLTVPGGMGGRETMERLRKLDPEVCALVSSGYSNDPIMVDAERYGFAGVVAKPYDLQDLSRALGGVGRRG